METPIAIVEKNKKFSEFRYADQSFDEEHRGAIATESIDSFKLKPEFVATANKSTGSFINFNSGLLD